VVAVAALAMLLVLLAKTVTALIARAHVASRVAE
jgi:hypothetical protein